jgi:hypothetical protein
VEGAVQDIAKSTAPELIVRRDECVICELDTRVLLPAASVPDDADTFSPAADSVACATRKVTLTVSPGSTSASWLKLTVVADDADAPWQLVHPVVE